jgi:hypothetical protein
VPNSGGTLTFEWDGPSSEWFDMVSGEKVMVHNYVIEKATSLNPPDFLPVSSESSERTATVEHAPNQTSFYRVRLMPRSF